MTWYCAKKILKKENSNDATRKLLELINEFGEVAGYKIIYRNLLHVYTPTMKGQKEKLRKQPHLSLHQKEQNTQEKNLPKEAEDLYSENC